MKLGDIALMLSTVTACIFIVTLYPYTVVILTEHSKFSKKFLGYLTLSSAIALFLEVLALFLLSRMAIKKEYWNPSYTSRK